MAAFLAIVNVTSESMPYLAVPIKGAGGAFNAFGSIVTASYYTNSVGWFYYAQNFYGSQNPCATQFQGQTNTSFGTSGPWTTQNLTGPFPTLRLGLSGADYVGIIQRGLPGGTLLPTWHQAVVTSGSGNGCAGCSGYTVTLGVYAAQVSP